MKKRWYKVWPQGVPKSFEVTKPVSEFIREWSKKAPRKAALSFYGKDIAYQEINEAIDRFAWGLVNLGVKKGDRVALHMQNCPQFVIAFFGILRAGGVVVALNPMFKHSELEYEINDAQADTLVGLDYLFPEVEKVKDRVHLKHVILSSLSDYLPEEHILPLPTEAQKLKRSFPETIDFMELIIKSPQRPLCNISDMKKDLALLQYTGGTTGLPKGAMITHSSLGYASLGTAFWFHLSDKDIHLGVTPFFHVLGLIKAVCAPLISGGQVVVLSRFIPEIVAQAITHYRCTFWEAATTMYIALLELPDIKSYDLGSFRALFSGGTTISLEIQKKIKELAPDALIGEGYGLSETLAQGGAVTPLNRYKPGFLGIPQLNELKIVDLETGHRELPPYEQGEIVIKGPTIMKGYWNRPEETKEVLRDGWIYTGDIGLMDEEGYIKIVGRKRELIKCSGFTVFPPEVEHLLYRHPAVAEAAVIGIPDPYRGESPKAFIVLKSGYKGKIGEDEILAWCKENMATYKRPRAVEFRDELPKSGAAKILRRVLKDEEKDKTSNL